MMSAAGVELAKQALVSSLQGPVTRKTAKRHPTKPAHLLR
jgi:hypothetical protein